jgi:hypothetical protein
MATPEQIAEEFPSFAALAAIPEVRDLLMKAADGDWSSDRFTTALHETSWWKSTSEAARKADTLHLVDQQTWNLEIKEMERRIMAIQHQEGIGSDPQTVGAFAVMFHREGWSDDQVRSWLVSNEATYSKGGLTGAIDAAAQDIRKIASDYGLPVSDAWAREKGKAIRAGVNTIDGIKASFANQAKVTYQHLAPQLDQGFTIRDIAEPYLQSAAQLLEMSPSAMNLSDPRWSRALNAQGADGKTQLMSMGDWQKTIMSEGSYGWDRTNNAKAAAYDLRDKLADTFGVR